MTENERVSRGDRVDEWGCSRTEGPEGHEYSQLQSTRSRSGVPVPVVMRPFRSVGPGRWSSYMSVGLNRLTFIRVPNNLTSNSLIQTSARGRRPFKRRDALGPLSRRHLSTSALTWLELFAPGANKSNCGR